MQAEKEDKREQERDSQRQMVTGKANSLSKGAEAGVGWS